jgi:hypothetical protein
LRGATMEGSFPKGAALLFYGGGVPGNRRSFLEGLAGDVFQLA